MSLRRRCTSAPFAETVLLGESGPAPQSGGFVTNMRGINSTAVLPLTQLPSASCARLAARQRTSASPALRPRVSRLRRRVLADTAPTQPRCGPLADGQPPRNVSGTAPLCLAGGACCSLTRAAVPQRVLWATPRCMQSPWVARTRCVGAGVAARGQSNLSKALTTLSRPPTTFVQAPPAGVATHHTVVHFFRHPGLSEAKTQALLQKARAVADGHGRRHSCFVFLTTLCGLCVQTKQRVSGSVRSIDTELVRGSW